MFLKTILSIQIFMLGAVDLPELSVAEIRGEREGEKGEQEQDRGGETKSWGKCWNEQLVVQLFVHSSQAEDSIMPEVVNVFCGNP